MITFGEGCAVQKFKNSMIQGLFKKTLTLCCGLVYRSHTFAEK